MPTLAHRSGSAIPVAVLRSLGLVMLWLVLTACPGEPALDRDIDETRNANFSVKISITGKASPERLAAESPGLTLTLSDAAAEILGTSTETPLPLIEYRGRGYAKIDHNLFGVDATSGRWCDIGAMSIRDDLTGETFEFLHEDECLPMGDIRVDGIWNEWELGFR